MEISLVKWVLESNQKLRTEDETTHWWFIVSWNFGNKPQWNFDQIIKGFSKENAFKNAVCKIVPICLKLIVLIFCEIVDPS